MSFLFIFNHFDNNNGGSNFNNNNINFNVKFKAININLMEIFNAGPEPITLTRGQCIGQADCAERQLLTPFEAELLTLLQNSY
jgi:hypothetical protein